jgi:histidinol-phosphate aminotransferase
MKHLTHIHEHIKTINPYQLGRSTGDLATDLGIDINAVVRLAANENALGTSPKVQKVIQDYAKDCLRYPEVSVLQRVLGEYNNVDPLRIIPGNGSCEILELTAQTFLGPGLQSVYPLYSFVMYKLATQYVGAQGIAIAPRADFTDDLAAMLTAITPQTRVMWLSNVANPTGSYIPYAAIKQFITAIPSNIIVLLDEAYTEYLPDEERLDTTDWSNEFPNLILTRTFSKIYGLAGLRVGYGIASLELADYINRLRGPYNCNALAIAAVTAALEDQAFVEKSRAFNVAGRKQLTEGFRRLGFSYIEPAGNFVAVNVGNAREMAEKLMQKGIVVLPLHGYQLPEYIRVTVGHEAENRALLGAL